MNNSLRYICINFFFLLSFVPIATSQVIFQSNKELKKIAKNLFSQEKYVEAYPIYSQLYIRDPKDSEFNYYLGICTIYAAANKEQAIPFLEFAAANPETDKEVLYYLGKALLLSYRFEDAIVQFNAYKEKGSPKNVEKFQVDRQIEMCKNGIKLIRNITDWVVVDKKELSEKDFFLSYEISGDVGKLMNKPDEEMFKSSLDIKKKESSIIYLAKENNQIYFSSYGETEGNGKDIYRINKLPNGKWSKGQALQPTINTKEDEDFPFLHPNGKILYFCSKGHNSMGGYDIFKSNFVDSTNSWGSPVNMGFPINSPDDDILYVTDGGEKQAFFSSARTSPIGKYHVYKLNMERKPSGFALIRGIIKKNRAEQSLEMHITVRDIQDNALIGTFNTNDKNGHYFLVLPNGGTFTFTVESPGFQTQSEVITIPLQLESTPMRQEISYNLKTNKLVIKTINDELKGNKHVLPNIIKTKANLDVTGKAISKMEETAETPDEPVDEATAETETNDGNKATEYEDDDNTLDDNRLNNDDVIRIAYIRAKELDREAIVLRKQADAALNMANKKSEQAQKKSKEVELLKAELAGFTGDATQKKILKDKVDEANREAEQMNQQATGAFTIAQKLDVAAIQKRKQADLALQYAQALEAAAKGGNKPEAVAKATELEKELEEMGKANPDTDTSTLLANYKTTEENKKRDLAKVVETLDNIKKEISDNEALIVKTQADADATRKKDLKAQLENEIEGLRQDNIYKQDEIKKYENKVKKAQNEYDAIVKEETFATDLVNTAKAEAAASMVLLDKQKAAEKQIVTAAATTKTAKPLAVVYNVVPKPTVAKSNIAVVTPKKSLDKIVGDSTKQKTIAAVTKTPAPKPTTPVKTLVVNKTDTAAIIIATEQPVSNTLTATTTVAKAPVPTTEKGIDIVLNELNKKHEEELNAALKLKTEFERETANTEVFTSWAEDLEAFVSKEKPNVGTETNPDKKDRDTKTINEAERLSQEKKLLAKQSSLKADNLQQISLASTLPPTGETALVAELAATEKITNVGEREKAKEEIYKKLAAEAEQKASVLLQQLIAETDSDKKAAIAKEIEQQQQLAKQNKDLAKESLVNAETYFKNNGKAPDGVEEVVFNSPDEKTEKQENISRAPVPIVMVNPTVKNNDNLPPVSSKTIAENKAQLKIIEQKRDKIEIEKEKAALYKKWAKDLDTIANREKRNFAIETNAGKKAEIAKKIRAAEKEAKEKKELATKSIVNATYNSYKQSTPKVVLAKGEQFEVKSKPAYTDKKPIPIDDIPKEGLVYKVQVGAFKNPIPQSTFAGITPITAENTSFGYIRYLAGQLSQYASADKVKNEIRNLGFKDAFVVAFYNGKRISIGEANKMSGADDASLIASDTQIPFQNTTANVGINNNIPTNNTTDNNTIGNNTTGNVISAATTTNKVSAPKVNQTTTPVKAENVANVNGLFYTVQVGVFSQPMSASTFFNINPLFNEIIDGGKLRYTVGIYNSFPRANDAKGIALDVGINNAFVTAIYNSKRISLAEAKTYEVQGNSVFASSPVLNLLPFFGTRQVAVSNKSNVVANNNKQNANVTQPIPTTINSQNNTKPISINETTNEATTTTNNANDDIVYKVQIGAYRAELPVEKANVFFKIATKGLANYVDERGITIYTVGNFKTYEEANKLKTELATEYNLKDAFVVVYRNGKKATLDEVKK